MKLDKKQLPQLIILGVLVVACIGFVSFQLMGSKSVKPPAPLHKPDKTAASAETASVATPAEVIQGATEVGVFPQLNTVLPRRDPFQPVPMPTTVVETGKSQPPKPKTFTPPSHPFRPSDMFAGKVPALGVNPANPFSLVKGSKAAEQDKQPEFTLTGVVRGDRNVAIIRSPDSGRHVVKQGQVIDGRYRVLTVTDDSATLIYKNRRIHVKLGGVKNAS